MINIAGNRQSKIFFIIYIFIFINVFSLAKKDTNYFKRISIEHGLSQVDINCIIQDKQGFMWFGTMDGLNKYDGYKFTIYRHNSDDNTSLTKNYITALCEDEDGILWIGTDGGGLNRFDKKSETFLSYRHQKNNPNSLSNNFISSILVDKDGILWIGTFSGGLNKFDTKKEKFIHYKHSADNPNSLNNDEIGDIFEGREYIWIGTRGGLNRFDKNKETFTHYKHKINEYYPVLSIFEDAKGILWIGTKGGGLSKLNTSTGTFVNYKANPKNFRSISNNFVLSVFKDREGILWIGTYGGGLNRFDRKTGIFTKYQHQTANLDSLSNNSIASIFEDAEGILWIGTYGGGLNILDKKKMLFSKYNQKADSANSLSGKSVSSFYKGINGNVWIGTSNGLNKTDLNLEKFKLYQFQPNNNKNINNNYVYSISGDIKGDLWVGAFNGLYKFDNKKEIFNKIQYHDNFPARGITQVFEDTKRTLWIATDGDGLYKFDQKKDLYTSYNFDPDNPKSLSGPYVWSVLEDSNGIIWIGTVGGGLNKYNKKTETFTTFQHQINDPQSLSSNHIFDLFEDRGKNLWIGTDTGLNKFDREKKTFKYYGRKNGLLNEIIHAVLEDNEGYLWVSTNYGINKFNPKTGIFINYDKQDGLQGNAFNDGAKFKDSLGRLYFGGEEGFTVFDPEKVVDNKFIPPVLITDFLLFNKSVNVAKKVVDSKQFQLKQHINFTKEITLEYTDYIFTFEFSALNYRQPEKNMYKYKLEGLDSNWIETDYKNRRATYTNLSHGEYTFRVKGSNDDGYWNEEGTSVKIIILPPFWETVWFKALVLTMVLILMFFLYRSRIKKIRLKIRFEERVKNICSKNNLTKTEEEILFLILKGKTNKEIEDILFISSGTIRNSNSKIYKKLNIDNRMALIKMFKDLE